MHKQHSNSHTANFYLLHLFWGIVSADKLCMREWVELFDVSRPSFMRSHLLAVFEFHLLVYRVVDFAPACSCTYTVE